MFSSSASTRERIAGVISAESALSELGKQQLLWDHV